ncbi:hypothetical protein [Stigmatella aurantiaca]|uniref:Uncharacterized protein n=1 Tax=Stigmatella aurantiaca (strain DW4/3-1) TaxID=378806 RepID=Q09AH1_STIAD|nr:hypothetical protein [Stigmatella aurantiaca]ADO68018.1 uncharacterized protein STAUR_0209 [Stigmatella aurantiaca DW4/3-1]EAU68708.1 conserved hypothetical protein [Stigmatella aurantiaca DW4/3-1]
MSNGQKDLVVPMSFTPSVGTYLQRVQALGALEGSGETLAFSPHIHPVLEALHHVLAGGEVEVRIVRSGQATLVEELNALAERVLEESRALPPGLIVTAV